MSKDSRSARVMSNFWKALTYTALIGVGFVAAASVLNALGMIDAPFSTSTAIIALAVFTTGAITLIYNVYTSRDQAAEIVREGRTAKRSDSTDETPVSFGELQFETSKELDASEDAKMHSRAERKDQ